MSSGDPTFLQKFWWSLPWLLRYPAWRLRERTRRLTQDFGSHHVLVVVANHYEPAWHDGAGFLDSAMQIRRVEEWCRQARDIGRVVQDPGGHAFSHTYFFPAEQYDGRLLDQLSALQSEGLGEVEIHLHHGVEKPDTPENLRRSLLTFRDILALEHGCLSRLGSSGPPRYAFVHGNLALANSSGGRFCGVDSEMQILAETGCYGDFTLPSAPNRTQVPRINALYECGRPLHEAVPHRSGSSLRVGRQPAGPVLVTGPLVFDWTRRVRGLPVPRLDDGGLTENYPLTPARLARWRSANIGVQGRPEWVFVKLYCHGFFPHDQEHTIGEPIRRFLSDALELSARTGDFVLHFVTAREAFNIAMAAVDGRDGDPDVYRDYRLHPIRRRPP